MNTMTFDLLRYQKEAQALLEEARAAFSRLGLEGELPSSMQPEEGATKLVFVGQYSSGKSSLIKMLTGIDTGIAAEIKTDTASVYDWNGMEIVDTPGIATGLRPEHDARTKEEIAHAALLVFVITNEGFDRTMGNHFRNLAFEEKRSRNMVLVVNKMDRAVEGNSVAQHEVMLSDIRTVLAPCEPKDFYISFTSTALFDEAQEETEEEIKRELLEESGYDALVEHLNDFVRARGLAAGLAKPLYTLAEALRRALGVPAEVQAIGGVEDLTRRKLGVLDRAVRICEQELQDIAMTCQQKVLSIGSKVRGELVLGVTEEKFRPSIEEAGREVEACAKRGAEEMQQAFATMCAQLEREADQIMETPFAKQVAFDLEAAQKSLAPLERGGSADTVDMVKKIGEKLQTNALGKNAGTLMDGVAGNPSIWEFANLSLKGFSGSFMHEGVKTIGRLFGQKFAPWQALKIAKGFGWIGVALQVGGLLYTAYQGMTGGSKQKEAEAKLREVRDQLSAQFNEVANDLYTQMITNAKEALRRQTEPLREELQAVLRGFADRRERNEETETELGRLLLRTEKLLDALNQA